MKILFQILLTILLCHILICCEGKERFYRPNLPEMLCSIGIIDADDTTRYISFEKSYQAEYPEEINDSLKEFSFTISSSNNELFSYCSDKTIKNLQSLKIPGSITFNANEKFSLQAKEKSTQNILSEVVVPSPPQGLSLLSISIESTTLSEPEVCTNTSIYTSCKSAVFNISFENDKRQEFYFAIQIEGKGMKGFSSGGSQKYTPMEFSVRECNAPGFYTIMQGPKRINGFAKMINSS